MNPATATRRLAAWTVSCSCWCGSLGCSDEYERGDSGSQGTGAQQTASVTALTGAAGTSTTGGAVTHGVSTSTGGAAASTGTTATGGGDPNTASGDSGTMSSPTSSGNSGMPGGGPSGSTGSSSASSTTSSAGGVSSTMNDAGITGVGGSSPSGGFQLRWVDEFEAIDTSRWEPMTHSWDGNLAQFSATTVAVVDGVLSLSLVEAPEGATKPYLGVEYRSLETLTYGKVEARVRFARGSAVVSGLVLIYTPWPPDDWNELDIECLGTGQMQFNHMINIPPADPVSGHLQYPRSVELGFDPAADFHEYAVEWVPGEARFLVDGVLRHTATEEMSRMILPQNILLTIWASDAADWAGPVDSTTAPTLAEYDWIRVYDYLGP